MIGLLGGDDGSVGHQGEVDTGVGHQVGLELSQIDVQSTVESERSSNRRYDLTDQPTRVFSKSVY